MMQVVENRAAVVALLAQMKKAITSDTAINDETFFPALIEALLGYTDAVHIEHVMATRERLDERPTAKPGRWERRYRAATAELAELRNIRLRTTVTGGTLIDMTLAELAPRIRLNGTGRLFVVGGPPADFKLIGSPDLAVYFDLG